MSVSAYDSAIPPTQNTIGVAVRESLEVAIAQRQVENFGC